jgi:hypothetical protein
MSLGMALRELVVVLAWEAAARQKSESRQWKLC